MARPKSAEDPELHPEPCGRCGEHRALAVRWPDGKVCQNCRRKAIRTMGRCVECGHEGVLPGVSADGPTCRNCSGITLNVDCVRCGKEDELYSGGRCWRCTLSDLVDETLAHPATGTIPPSLTPLAAGLKQMERANSGLTWLRQPHVQTFLRTLTCTPTTHEALDQLPPSATLDYVRALLVEHCALPRRDEYLATFNRWLTGVPDRLLNHDDRDILLRYVRWDHLRKMHQEAPISRGMFLRSKQSITVGVEFLNWLAERKVDLQDLSQSDLDDWVAGGKTTRLVADRFLNWARRSRLVNTDLKMARHRRGTASRMSLAEQRQANADLSDADAVDLRDRAAGVLVLVFGQRVEDIVRLTWSDVTITRESVTIRLAGMSLPIPSPFDDLWRQLRQTPRHQQTAAHPNSTWIFPGQKPGQPVNPDHLANRLRQHLQVRAARLGALNELTKLAPVTIAAEALGYATTTLERHSVDSGATYARYIATVKAMGGAPLPREAAAGSHKTS
ncbi:Fis family transcriptional regulator [Microbacterium flavescens]|uniref:Fis family transcriptional regulator n=1 Tax=Microbacterium flavescens TaxID=69366 RepID=UPI001BDEDF9C|nr:Fis family transcriptional regulator [Microbacterium flavescens]